MSPPVWCGCEASPWGRLAGTWGAWDGVAERCGVLLGGAADGRFDGAGGGGGGVSCVRTGAAALLLCPMGIVLGFGCVPSLIVELRGLVLGAGGADMNDLQAQKRE